MSIGNMIGFGSDSGKGKSSYARISECLHYKRSVDQKDDRGIVLSDNMEGSIEAKKIVFSYPCRLSVPVYKDISFKSKGGHNMALIGPSGAGKSTFIQLLQRFYTLAPKDNAKNFRGEGISDSARGSIKIDGINIEDIQLKSLRSKIALVEQMPLLFSSLTIGQNIAMGVQAFGRNATQEEIESAARSANAHDFITELPHGYDTTVGLGGASMSGGQKQRIAIARALIRNPKILLLDEATSALDAESEKQVQHALMEIDKKYASGLTSITIAHRLSTVKNSNQIICMNNLGQGSVVSEQGTHDELLEMRGLYYQMVLAAER